VRPSVFSILTQINAKQVQLAIVEGKSNERDRMANDPEVERVLGAILKNGIDVHRCAAARALGQLPGSAPVLRQALLDEDEDVRTDAAAALCRIGDPATAEALMENLVSDPECDVKKEALQALVAMRHQPVIGLLRKLARERSADVVWDEDEFFQDGWDSWVDMQVLAIRGLGEFGDRDAVPDILAALADEYGQNVDDVAVQALIQMGREGAGALADLYLGGPEPLRRRIARAAAQGDQTFAQSLISAMLEDASAPVREIAALGLAPDDARLAALFDDPAARVRIAVLGHAGHLFAAQTRTRITDPEAMVRAAAFRVIAANVAIFDDPDTAKAVKDGIAGDPLAAVQAARAWVALKGPAGIKGLTHAMTNASIPLDFRVQVVQALSAAGPAAVPHLLKAVGDPHRQLRLAAMTALAGFAANDPVWPNAAGEGLLAALDGSLVAAPEPELEPEVAPDTATDAAPDTDTNTDTGTKTDAPPELTAAEVQEIEDALPLVPETGAQSTLGAILSPPDVAEGPETPPPAVPDLDEKQKHLLELARQPRLKKRKMALEIEIAPHTDVRRFAATLLGDVRNPDVTLALTGALEDADPQLAAAALESLCDCAGTGLGLPEAALAPIRRILETGTSEARVLAARALGFAADDQTRESLAALLADPDDLVRAQAVRSLDRRGVADARIEACLNDPYLGVATAAATALARNRPARAAPLLVAFACRHDGTYRRDIGQLLAEHARDGGRRCLLDMLADEDQRRNWLVALDALAEILAHPDENPGQKAA
jgi:HEAT repeat protein